MPKPNCNSWQKKAEKKYAQRDKKKKRNMKVSGAAIRQLSRIIKEKK